MHTLDLLESLDFHPERATATPLLVDESGRVLRFTLRAGRELREHRAPHSPVHIVVLRGRGLFASADGSEAHLGPGTMVVFATGELHRVRALDEDLVFVAVLHPAEERVG